jgi:hypothetical protein
MASIWGSGTAQACVKDKNDIEEALLPSHDSGITKKDERKEGNSDNGPISPQKNINDKIRNRLTASESSDVTFGPAIFVLVSYLGIGFLSYWSMYDQISGTKTNSVVDALYFSIVTLTTVGYGGVYMILNVVPFCFLVSG